MGCSRKTGRLGTAFVTCAPSRGLETKKAAWAKHKPRRLPRARSAVERAVARSLLAGCCHRQLAPAGLAAPSPPGPPLQISATAAKRAHGRGARRSRCGGGPNKTLASGPTAWMGKRLAAAALPHAFPFDIWLCGVRARPDWSRLAGPARQSGLPALLRATPACVVLCGAGCPAGPGRWRPPPSPPQRHPHALGKVGRPGPPGIRDCHQGQQWRLSEHLPTSKPAGRLPATEIGPESARRCASGKGGLDGVCVGSCE